MTGPAPIFARKAGSIALRVLPLNENWRRV